MFGAYSIYIREYSPFKVNHPFPIALIQQTFKYIGF